MLRLARIELSGFKSIEQMSLEMRPMNVLIGANGAGKSNFVSFFRLLAALREGRLGEYVRGADGASRLLFYGPAETERVSAELSLEEESEFVGKYCPSFMYAANDKLMIEVERFDYVGPPQFAGAVEVRPVTMSHFSRGCLETAVPEAAAKLEGPARRIWDHLGSLQVFQFHDTSMQSAVRRPVMIHDNRSLRHNAGNLAAVLYKLRQKQPVAYRRIVETIRQIAPWFDHFAIEPLALSPEKVALEWRDKWSDEPFFAFQLPDGALRAMALVTLLLQPEEDLPTLLVIDEPELGLHPYALAIVAGLAQAAACHCQVILATQSVAFLEHFDPEDIVVVDRQERATTFRRLSSEGLDDWLEDYTLGELWEKNVLGGGPA